MTSPSGKRLVRATIMQHFTYLIGEREVTSCSGRELALSGPSNCHRYMQLELIVEARNLKKTLGFLQPELLAEYAKQVGFRLGINV